MTVGLLGKTSSLGAGGLVKSLVQPAVAISVRPWTGSLASRSVTSEAPRELNPTTHHHLAPPVTRSWLLQDGSGLAGKSPDPPELHKQQAAISSCLPEG